MAKKKRSKILRDEGGFNQIQATAILEALGFQDEIADAQTVDPNSPAVRDQIQVVGPPQLFVSPTQGGDPPATAGDVDTWTRKQPAPVVTDLSVDESRADTVRAYLDLPGVVRWDDSGAVVKNYQCFFEIDDPSTVCPFSTEQPPETWETWGTAGNPNQGPQQIGNLWYRSNQDHTNQGIPIDSDLWAGFILTPNTPVTGIVRTISTEEYLAIVEANQPPTP